MKLLIDAANAAGQVALDAWTDIKVDWKGDRDPVTEADRLAQEAAIKELRSADPHTAIVAEELSDPVISESTFYVIDPIDGTACYMHKGRDWAVLVAKIENWVPTAGVLFLPAREILVSAEAGEGCYLNGEKVELSQDKGLSQYLVTPELGNFSTPDDIDKLRKLCGTSLGIRTLYSSGGNGVDLLLGLTGLYYHGGGKIWDFAASAVALQEAGGVCRARDGSEITWNSIDMDIVLGANATVVDQFFKL